MLQAEGCSQWFNLRRRAVIATVVGAAAFASSVALAQSDFPNKPVHFIVGFAPGGPSDIISRVIGAKMGDELGQQVVVENRTGAGGTVATDYVARSDPDGYTILNTTTANPSNESLSKTLQARFGKDLAAVATLADTANILVVHPSLGVEKLADLIALAKKEGLLYATAGVGSATHLTSELFNSMAGVKTMPVHYRGGGDALKDLLSGQVKMMFSSIAPVIGYVQEGKLIGIATTGAKRDPAFQMADLDRCRHRFHFGSGSAPTPLGTSTSGLSGACATWWGELLRPAPCVAETPPPPALEPRLRSISLAPASPWHCARSLAQQRPELPSTSS
jgi:tripartite-type tricarboxylate transporter receptor subunit TctC